MGVEIVSSVWVLFVVECAVIIAERLLHLSFLAGYMVHDGDSLTLTMDSKMAKADWRCWHSRLLP